MDNYGYKGFALALIAAVGCGRADAVDAEQIRLPQPALEGELARVLQQRRSVREFAPKPLSLETLSQLLWATQGISSPRGLRTAPSAGALYPLELHLVAGQVEGLPAGSYRYDPRSHGLRPGVRGDLRLNLARAALNQSWIAQAPAAVVITAVPKRTTRKYGERGIRYVHIEVGHAGQNLLLQAVALSLGGTVVGAFDDEAVQRLLGLPAGEQPFVIVPVGYPH